MTNRIFALILTVVFMSLTVSCSTETADKITAQKDNNSPATTEKTENTAFTILTDTENSELMKYADNIAQAAEIGFSARPEIIAYNADFPGPCVVFGAGDKSGLESTEIDRYSYAVKQNDSFVTVSCNEETAQAASEAFISELQAADYRLGEVNDCKATLLDTLNDGLTILSESTVTIADGVIRTDYVYEKANGEKVLAYKTEIAPGAAKVTIGTANDTNEATGKQCVYDQAKLYESLGKDVVLAINADFFGEGGEPCGLLIKNGETQHKIRGGCFFGVLKNGDYACGNAEEFKKYKYDDFENAVGAGHWIVSNASFTGTETIKTMAHRDPRSAIGYKQDGTVIILAVDGRQPGLSIGITMYDLATLMIDYGCDEAVNLDGGGSTQLVMKNPGNSQLEVVNSPCQVPYRKVFDTILIVK